MNLFSIPFLPGRSTDHQIDNQGCGPEDYDGPGQVRPAWFPFSPVQAVLNPYRRFRTRRERRVKHRNGGRAVSSRAQWLRSAPVTWTVPAITWLAVGEVLAGRSRQVVFAAAVMVCRYWACLHLSRSAILRRSLQQQRGRGRSGDGIFARLSSSGWRRSSSTRRRNSASSSKKSTPGCASDTAPGRGTWPPPIRPTFEMV